MTRISRIVSALMIVAMMITCVGAVTTVNVSAATTSQATTKVTTKTTTKTTTKNVKMKSKATTSKVQTKKQTKVTTKTTATSAKKVVTKTTVQTTTQSTFKKKSNIKKVKTTVKTTVQTTTTTQNSNNTSSSTEKVNETAKTPATVAEIRKAVPKNLLGAFDELEFKIKINKNVSYDGVFSTKDHQIELKEAKADVLLHEMGHFLSALKCNAADSSEFKAIYKDEKKDYEGTNKSYVTSTNNEYFAESYKDYVKNPSKLKKDRPETYAYVKELADNITQKDIDTAYSRYSWAW